MFMDKHLFALIVVNLFDNSSENPSEQTDYPSEHYINDVSVFCHIIANLIHLVNQYLPIVTSLFNVYNYGIKFQRS